MSGLRISEALIFFSIRFLYAYLRHALCLGLVYPRPSLSLLSRGLWIYQPLRGCLCVMSAWCCGGVLRCVPVWLLWGNVRGWSGGGGSCLWSELARWGYARTFGTLSAWGVVFPRPSLSLLSRGLWIYISPSGAVFV